MNDESVRGRVLEAIENGGWIDGDSGPCQVECLDVSAEWFEVGGVREYEFERSDLQGLAEMRTSATDPCSGHERRLYEGSWVIVKEVDDVVHQFLCQVHLRRVEGGGNWTTLEVTD